MGSGWATWWNKKDLSIMFGLNVDIANADFLKEVSKKYILPETVYVT